MRRWLLTMSAVVIGTGAIGAQKASDAADVRPGRDLFATYCASCHGIGARGNGPAAEELRRRPADLTQFAKRNGGVFNSARIHSIVDGRAVKAHGTIEMPVWGDAFKWREGLPEDGIKVRIEALIRYLESIQERASH
ncbi:MAG: c-type cytochrome [Acidobacteriota bacterium]